MTELWDYVQRYLDWNLCVIPIPHGHKEPLILWKKYQTERPSREELEAWFQSPEPSNIAIVCGEVSDNFYPLDFDSEETLFKFFPSKEKLFSLTPVVKTGRGYHVWMKSSKPLDLSKRAIESLRLEVLGERHFVIAPPSLHPSGKNYEFLNPEVAQISALSDYVGDFSERISGLLGKPFRLDVYRKALDGTLLEAGPPYRGPTPACIERLYGIEEGLRNEAAMRIASFLLITRKLNTADCWKRLQKWNDKNKPPLDQNELRALFVSVNERGYVYGCDDKLKEELCVEPQVCPLAKYDVPPEVEEEVERILDSDQPLVEIKCHLDNLIAGEDFNKQLVFLLLLSGKSQDPLMKQMVLLSGDAGVGKTTLMTIADLFMTKTVGRFTAHALDYSKLEGYEVLRLQEIGHADEEKQGVATVKFLSPDDKGFVVEFTVRDPETGEFITKQKRIPPITFVSGTTRIELDPQFERRNWLIFPDDSEAQTKKIRSWLVNFEMQKNEVALGLRKWTDYDYSKIVLKELVKKLKGVTILVPFPKTLMDIFKTDILRVRGDYKKVLTLVKLYGMLNKNALPRIPVTNSAGYLATPRSAIDLLEIAEEPLVYMTSQLKKRTARMLTLFKDIGVAKAGATIADEERTTLAQNSGLSDVTIRIYLNSLQKHGLLWGSDQKPKTWKLLYDLDEIQRNMSAISVKIKITDDLIANASKEAREWLKTTSVKLEGRGYISTAEIERILERFPVPPETHTLPSQITDPDLGEKQPSSPEPKAEQRKIDEITISRTLFTVDEVVLCSLIATPIPNQECDYCGKKTTLRWQVDTFKKGVYCVCNPCGEMIDGYWKERRKLD